jgi:PAS domain S-box-containing protein
MIDDHTPQALDSDAHLRTLIDASPDCIKLVAPDGMILEMNRAGLAMLQAESLEQARCKRLAEYVAPAQREAFLALSRRVLGGASETLEFEVIGLKGGRRWLETHATPLRHGAGGVVALLGITRDITEKRRIVSERDENLALLRLVIDSVPAYIGLVDADERYRLINRRYEEWFLRPSAEITGHRLREIHSPAAYEAMRPYVLRALAGEEVCWERVIEDLTGRRHWLEMHYVPHRCDGERADGFFSLVFDITERRDNEEAVRKLNAELDLRVKERTAELMDANKELEAFSYSVSHDLRAPLRALDGYSQTLLEDYAGRLDEPARHCLRRIRAAATRMARTIDDLLELARLSRRQLGCQSVDLGQLAHRIMRDLHSSAPQRHLEFVAPARLAGWGDPSLLRAALTNLLDNAWKYTRNCSQAHIEFGRTERNGEPIWFVRDNGVGFDMAYAGRLFEAFQRLHPESEFEGSGIGLAIVQRIVRRHGGRIWAESAPGQGATFHFTLSEPVTPHNG